MKDIDSICADIRAALDAADVMADSLNPHYDAEAIFAYREQVRRLRLALSALRGRM